MARHEESFQVYGLPFVLTQVGAAGLSCHVPARTESTQCQGSALVWGMKTYARKSKQFIVL